jgi:hypothetical protein
MAQNSNMTTKSRTWLFQNSSFHFVNTTILETFDNVKKYNTHITFVSVYPIVELSCIEWALEFY